MNGKHHYLPQFYLRGFLNGNSKKLYYCRTQYDTYKQANTAGIYYSEGANFIDLGDYAKLDYEKDFYQELDNKYAQAFHCMVQNEYDVYKMPEQTKADIVEFFLGLYWRIPNGYRHVAEVVRSDGFLNVYIELCDKYTGHIYTDDEIPNIKKDIISSEVTQRVLLPSFYIRNIRKHPWDKLNDKFLIFETNEPMLIGDTPYVALKTECKSGKILEEFMAPLDKNHLLIYAQDKPSFLDSTLLHVFNTSIIYGESEKIVCSDKEYMYREIENAKVWKKRLELMGMYNATDNMLAKFMKFQSQFLTYDNWKRYFYNHNNTVLINDFWTKTYNLGLKFPM